MRSGFPQSLWNCRVTLSANLNKQQDSTYPAFPVGFPSFWKTLFHDGWSWLGAGCTSELSGALQGADSGEGFAALLQREQAGTCQSQRLPHTTLRHYRNTWGFLIPLFLIKRWVYLLLSRYFHNVKDYGSLSALRFWTAGHTDIWNFITAN